MTEEEGLFWLNDRIEKIKQINEQFNLEVNSYLSFSGGKDSLVLHYPPFNFKRTGCKGCPFALDLQRQLDVMQRLLPVERKQCEIIWKPVYEEYRRIGYRLRKKGQPVQTTIFDFIEVDYGKI